MDMELSYFLAQLIGLVCILLAIAGLLRPKFFLSVIRDLNHDSSSIFVAALITMSAGIAIVLAHNVWDGTWRVWITLFGWVILLKGFAYLVAPKQLLHMGRSLYKNETVVRWLFVTVFFIGIYFTYMGFGY